MGVRPGVPRWWVGDWGVQARLPGMRVGELGVVWATDSTVPDAPPCHRDLVQVPWAGVGPEGAESRERCYESWCPSGIWGEGTRVSSRGWSELAVWGCRPAPPPACRVPTAVLAPQDPRDLAEAHTAHLRLWPSCPRAKGGCSCPGSLSAGVPTPPVQGSRLLRAGLSSVKPDPRAVVPLCPIQSGWEVGQRAGLALRGAP